HNLRLTHGNVPVTQYQLGKLFKLTKPTLIFRINVGSWSRPTNQGTTSYFVLKEHSIAIAIHDFEKNRRARHYNYSLVYPCAAPVRLQYSTLIFHRLSLSSFSGAHFDRVAPVSVPIRRLFCADGCGWVPIRLVGWPIQNLTRAPPGSSSG